MSNEWVRLFSNKRLDPSLTDVTFAPVIRHSIMDVRPPSGADAVLKLRAILYQVSTLCRTRG